MHDPVTPDDLGVLIADVEHVSSIAEVSRLRAYGLRRFAGDPRTGALVAACRERLRELTGFASRERDEPPRAR